MCILLSLCKVEGDADLFPFPERDLAAHGHKSSAGWAQLLLRKPSFPWGTAWRGWEKKEAGWTWGGAWSNRIHYGLLHLSLMCPRLSLRTVPSPLVWLSQLNSVQGSLWLVLSPRAPQFGSGHTTPGPGVVVGKPGDLRASLGSWFCL